MEMEREEKGQREQRQWLQGETECEPFILSNVYWMPALSQAREAKSLGCKRERMCNSNQQTTTPWDRYCSPHCRDEEIEALQWACNLSKDTELINSINLVLGVFYYSQAFKNTVVCLFLNSMVKAQRIRGKPIQSLFRNWSGKKIMNISYSPFMNFFLPWRINMWESWVLTYKRPGAFWNNY